VDERPCLRPNLEAHPIERDGKRLIALHDSDSYAPETALVEPGTLGILALFDGTRTLEEIGVELTKHGAGVVTVEALQELVDSLDRCLLLDNARFAEAYQQRESEFVAAPVRPAAHVGQAYPEDGPAARAFLDELLAHAPVAEPEPCARLIAPHIDLALGAEVHAHAHRRLAAADRPDAVIVLGVCHAATSRRFILCPKDFATPLGTVRYDARLGDALEEKFGEDLTHEQLVHKDEHSVEFQALWLAHHWPDDTPRIVPILVGSFHDFVTQRASPSVDPEVERFIEGLRAVIAEDGRRVVVVASVDFAHVGPRYGDPAGLDAAAERDLEYYDETLLEPIRLGRAESFFRAVSRDGNARHVCGVAPVYVTLRLGDGGGELLRYGQGRIDPETGSVVSYAAISFAR